MPAAIFVFVLGCSGIPTLRIDVSFLLDPNTCTADILISPPCRACCRPLIQPGWQLCICPFFSLTMPALFVLLGLQQPGGLYMVLVHLIAWLNFFD